MKHRILTCAALLFSATPLLAEGLTGSTVVITNTFQGGQTGGVEVDVAAFDLANNQFGVVGDGIEFPDFITLYDVDISADGIAFKWGDGDFAQSLAGPTPDGNHDRNYLIFDLPEGKTITSATYDPAASDLLADSAEPKIAVLGPNRLVIDFDGGVVRGAGFNPAFKVTVE